MLYYSHKLITKKPTKERTGQDMIRGYVVTDTEGKMLEPDTLIWLSPPSPEHCQGIAFWKRQKAVEIRYADGKLVYPGYINFIGPMAPCESIRVSSSVYKTVNLPQQSVCLGYTGPRRG